MNLIRPNLLALFAVALLTACGASPTDGGTDGNGDGARAIKENPLFGEDIQEIFTRAGCSSTFCHGIAKHGGLSLVSTISYENLVNVASMGRPELDRVEPGDVNNSYLWLRVAGTAAGRRMPQGFAPLNKTDLTNIGNWIKNGAPNN